MECVDVRRELHRISDGERLDYPWAYPAVLLHCRACAGCRAARLQFRLLRTATRRLSSGPAPEILRARVLEQIAGEVAAPAINTIPRRALPLAKLTVAAAVTVAITAALLMLPRSPRAIAAADVRAALQRVNTWHLSGWKLVEGRHVGWEVWGRRSPFYYRERLGDEWVEDDGRERIQLLPPNPPVRQGPGLVVRTVSRPGDANTGWDFDTMFAAWQHAERRWKETADAVVFNNNSAGMEGPGTFSNYLYTVDKRTALPVRFEVQRGNHSGSPITEAEFASISYGGDVPAHARLSAVPPGFKVVDALAPAPNLARQDRASRNGLTVELTPLAVNEEGFVLVRGRAWLGAQPLERRGALFMNVFPLRSLGITLVDPPGTVDDQGRPYIDVHQSRLLFGAADTDWLILYVPVEPLRPGDPLPRLLTMTVNLKVFAPQPVSGLSRMTGGHDVASERLTVTARLPERAAPFDLDEFVPGWQGRIVLSDPEPLDVSVAEARSLFYGDVINWQDPAPVVDRKWRSCVRWLKAAISLAVPGSHQADMLRGQLLQEYHFWAARFRFLGDNARAIALLKETITEAREHPGPNVSYWRDHAERDLREMGIAPVP